jgi:hypothetical protein
MLTAEQSPAYNNARDWHIHYVYHDPEFIAEVAALKELEEKIGESPKPEELQELEVLRQELATSYAINTYDIFRFRAGEIIPMTYETSNAELHIDPLKKEFSIKFSPFSSKAEIIEEWGKFEEFRAEMFPIKPTKRKPPEQPHLIYAIFKCRKHAQTFNRIFEQYSAGELPGYTGSAKDYIDVKKLEEWYNKFKPIA